MLGRKPYLSTNPASPVRPGILRWAFALAGAAALGAAFSPLSVWPVALVALAPWLERSDPVHTLAGRHLVAGHGSRDRITSPRATEAYVRRAEQVAASATYVELPGRGHYMLRGLREWNRFALRSTLEVLTLGGVDLRRTG